MAGYGTNNLRSSGIQSYWGGIAMRVILSAIFPSFHRMPNTLPLRYAQYHRRSALPQ